MTPRPSAASVRHVTCVELQAQAKRIRAWAEDQLAQRLAEHATLDGERRCAIPEQNLVASVSQERWTLIAPQLAGGDGGALEPSAGHRPRFCSAFSSSALAVNTFGPFRRGRPLALPGVGAFDADLEFEAKRPAGAPGGQPSLDVVAEPPDAADWLFVESACLEYLRGHATPFSAAFVAQADELLGPEAAASYRRFHDDRDGYCLLDAAQLLKHFLAAKLAAGGHRRVTLLYAFWEPQDADDHPVHVAHRREAARLAGDLTDPDVRLVALDYPSLWRAWAAGRNADLERHAGALRARYGVAIARRRG